MTWHKEGRRLASPLRRSEGRRGNGSPLRARETKDDDRGPKTCTLRSAEQQHGFLFSYKIEVWKAKFLGVYTHVDTIEASLFGPLLHKAVAFTWVDDS